LDLHILKTCTDEVIQLESANQNDSTNVFVLNKIAKAYLKMDNKEGALIYINKALMLDRENVEALSMFAQIKSINQ
jgi:hypothetical protein